jgi:hypothetical protein
VAIDHAPDQLVEGLQLDLVSLEREPFVSGRLVGGSGQDE